MAREDLHFRLRIPEDLKSRIENAAAENHRSMTAEIISRLEESFLPPNQALVEATLLAESLRANLEAKFEANDHHLARLETREKWLNERELELDKREFEIRKSVEEKVEARRAELEARYASLMESAQQRYDEAHAYAKFTVARERQFIETIKAITGKEPPSVDHVVKEKKEKQVRGD